MIKERSVGCEGVDINRERNGGLWVKGEGGGRGKRGGGGGRWQTNRLNEKGNQLDFSPCQTDFICRWESSQRLIKQQ